MIALHQTLPLPVKFSADDAERAFEEWGANCGPGAIAAMCGLTLDELRPHLGDFETKRYTNPTLMWQVLDNLRVRWSLKKTVDGWPEYGLARVQWEGPWTAPGVQMRVRYRQTHWVGAIRLDLSNVGIFDINAMGNGSGWCSHLDWERVLVPYILAKHYPKANGRWHLTHVVEMERA